MEISSQPVNSQTGEFTCYEQSESVTMHGSVFSEPSERRHHHPGSESIPNEQGETRISENTSQRPLSEHLGSPPVEVSQSDQAGKSSCPQKISFESVHEPDSGNVHGERSDQENHLFPKPLQNKPIEINSALSSCADLTKLQLSSLDAADSSLTETLDPHPQDVIESIKTRESLNHQQITLVQHESGYGVLHSEASKEKDKPGSELVTTRLLNTSPAVPSCTAEEKLLSTFANVTKSCTETECGELPSEDVSNCREAGKCLSSQQMLSERLDEFGSTRDSLEQKCQLGCELVRNKPEGTIIAVSSLSGNSNAENVELLPEDVSSSQIGKSSCLQQNKSEQSHEYVSLHGEQKSCLDTEFAQNVPVETSSLVPSSLKDSPIVDIGPPSEVACKNLGIEELRQPPEDMANNSMLEQLKMPSRSAVNNTRRLGCRDKRTPKSLKKKYMLRSLVASDRVLRSRARARGKLKATESSHNPANVRSMEEKQRKRKNRREKRRVVDEFSKIRTHLRYLLNRINYEQSLIDAYSSEGWKGGSLEKLKPEKELQRATSEILRRKLKIRDLFERLNSLCAEGRLAKSLFDSEGQICSEDIFCAKCGSKDLSLDNDIILCDGACDRGFHQYCLEPPLFSEDIPPDEEGWLCPGCDCKVDCVDLLNDSQGTNLSVTDSWEKVFPEAAATAAHNADRNFGLPSDDSDDNDYDPEEPDDEQVQGDESSSDESEYASADEELEASPNGQQDLGLPSDDSEDDDYDPDAPAVTENDKKESSSSDFTSDSEDLAAALDDNKSSGDDEGSKSASNNGIKPLRSSGGQKFKGDRNKQSLNDELLSILESDSGQDGSTPVSGKRHVERLDYKKLHDETYGNVPTSSDDEEYDDTPAPRRRKKTAGESATESPNGKNKETDHTSRRRTHKKANVEDTNSSPTKSPGGSCKSTSSGKSARSSAYRRLGEAVTQRLYKSFKENHYPQRATKESLAQELGLTFQQVSKWFENTRWSFQHSSRMEATAANTASKDTPSQQTSENQPVPGPDKVISSTICNGAEHASPSSVPTAESSGDKRDSELENSEAANSRKRKGRSNIHEPNSDVRAEELPKANEVQLGGIRRTRWRR